MCHPRVLRLEEPGIGLKGPIWRRKWRRIWAKAVLTRAACAAAKPCRARGVPNPKRLRIRSPRLKVAA